MEKQKVYLVFWYRSSDMGNDEYLSSIYDSKEKAIEKVAELKSKGLQTRYEGWMVR